MRLAIYQFQNAQGDCPSCNQAGSQMIAIGRESCQNKARELFGDSCEFVFYLDRSQSPLTGNNIHQVANRPRFTSLLRDIEKGEIDAVILTYMGDLSMDEAFILDFYRFLKGHGVKLVTVREGFRIMDMLDKVLFLASF